MKNKLWILCALFLMGASEEQGCSGFMPDSAGEEDGDDGTPTVATSEAMCADYCEWEMEYRCEGSTGPQNLTDCTTSCIESISPESEVCKTRMGTLITCAVNQESCEVWSGAPDAPCQEELLAAQSVCPGQFEDYE